jgi:phage gp29-like protein
MAWTLPKFFQRKEVKQPDTGEIASTDSTLSSGLNFQRFNPDSLVGRKGLQVYDRMRIDDQVKSCMSLKKNATLHAGWFIEPASESTQDTEIAEFVEFNLNKLRGTFSNNLKEIMTALDYGYSITEKVWKVVEEGNFKGKWAYQALKTKQPHNFLFATDEFDNILPDGIINQTLGKQERLPITKFIIYSYDQEFGDPYGRSDLRAAYRNWWSKDNILKFWNIFLERFGSPLIWGKYMNPSQQAELERVLKNLQNKTSITSPKQGGFEIELIESQQKSGGGKSEYQEALEFHNKAISNALLVPSRVKDDGEGGARAEASVRFSAFLWTIGELQRVLEELIVDEQIIRDLVTLNFPNVQELPKFKFNPMTQEQKIEIATVFGELVQKGAISAELESENFVRRLLDFPELDELPEKEEPVEPEGGQPDIEPEEKEFAERKTKTEIEKGIDFTAIENTLDSAEAKAMTDYQGMLTQQKDQLLSVIGRKYPKGGITTQFIKSLEMPKKAGLKKIALEVVNELYANGRRDGRSELPQRFATATQGDPVTPTQALNFLQSKTDFTVKGINDPLLADIQKILNDAIQTGIATNEVIRQIEQAYIPYLSDGTVIVDDKQLRPFRLEAIVRTTINESYNWGRRDIGEDPDLEGFIVGYQYSEILDARTTEISRFVDRKIIDVTNPRLNELSYPLHFSERGVFAYVTIDDQPVTFMSDAEIATAISMKGI